MLSRCFGCVAALFVVVNGVLAADVELNGHTFTLADDFEISLAAQKPITERPIHIDFDDKGRLYVAESSGSNDNVRVQLEQKPHSILRLEDSDGDGVFDKRTVFADRMMFPEGMLWYDGSVYVGAPPQIWKLTDTDDDGVADKREVWFDAKTLNGCANDLHGPYLGPDGWIYWCKGAFETQTYERPGRKPLVTRASHMFRRRPQGGLVESVMTGGMDNPVEVAFSRGGERFFTTTFLTHPRDGKRDGIIHAIYGGVYGKDHGVLAGHPRTGELMPVLSHFGAAAPCGLTRVRTKHLGDAYRDNLLVCQFNMHKVSRHELVSRDGSFTSVDSDLVRSNNLDFHPTDVLEDADGSLLVVDTGGWYKLCCPTSQLYKPDIPGAIYRIRRKAAAAVDDGRGQKIAWGRLSHASLAGLVADPRHAVRDRARTAVQKRGVAVVPPLRKQLSHHDVETRLNTVWALTRIGGDAARTAVRMALSDPADTVRQAAIHSVSVWQDQGAIPALIPLLAKTSIGNRRAAAEALGRMGQSGPVVDALLSAAATAEDRATEHSITYALMEIADAAATARGLTSKQPRTQRAALIAIDQMHDGALLPAQVIVHLGDGNPILQQTAWWIVERHPEWAAELAVWFRTELLSPQAQPGASEQASVRLAAITGDAKLHSIMAEALQSKRVGIVVKQNVLHAMASARPGKLPEAWSVELSQLLAEKNGDLLGQTVATLNALVGAKLDTRLVGGLLKVSADQKQSKLLRIQALATSCQANSKSGRSTVLDRESMAYV
ncbi:MAG: PVC-type heme-binding CxxCH protein, partial [Planctomycetaceae bacterium]